MNAAGKTSPIFSFGTNIRYFIQSKGDAITGGASVSVGAGIVKPCMARFALKPRQVSVTLHHFW